MAICCGLAFGYVSSVVRGLCGLVGDFRSLILESSNHTWVVKYFMMGSNAAGFCGRLVFLPRDHTMPEIYPGWALVHLGSLVYVGFTLILPYFHGLSYIFKIGRRALYLLYRYKKKRQFELKIRETSDGSGRLFHPILPLA